MRSPAVCCVVGGTGLAGCVGCDDLDRGGRATRGLAGLGVAGERQGEGRALALDRPHGDVAAVGGGDVLDDREPEAGAAGGAVAGRVDAVEPLEDAVDVLGGDADALVDHRDLDLLALGAGGDDHPGTPARVGDGVGDEVAHRGADLLLRAEDLQAVLAARLDGDLLGGGLHGAGVDGGGDRGVEVDHDRLLERVVALEAGELDDLLHQLGQAVALGEHPAGEALDRLGVVGGVGDGLGEQPDGADRGLELVADVGDEVAAHRLDPLLARAVLDQGEHQPGAQGRDAGGEGAHRPPSGPCRSSSLSRICPSRRTCATRSSSSGDHDRVAAHQPEGVRRRRGLERRGRTRRRRPRWSAGC